MESTKSNNGEDDGAEPQTVDPPPPPPPPPPIDNPVDGGEAERAEEEEATLEREAAPRRLGGEGRKQLSVHCGRCTGTIGGDMWAGSVADCKEESGGGGAATEGAGNVADPEAQAPTDVVVVGMGTLAAAEEEEEEVWGIWWKVMEEG